MTDYLYLSGGASQQPTMACPDFGGATRLRLAGRVLADADTLTAVVGHQDTVQFLQSISSASVLQVKVSTSVGGGQVVNSDVSGVDLTAAKTWIMADVDAGAGTVDFYYSVTDTNTFESVVWTQVGAQKSLSGTGETFTDQSGTSTFWGATNHVGGSGLVGQIHAGVIEADGVVVTRVDFTDLTDAEVDAAEFVAETGQTVTLEGTDWWYAQPGRNGAGPNHYDMIDTANLNFPVHTEGAWVPSGGDLRFEFKVYREWDDASADYILSAYGSDGNRVLYSYLTGGESLVALYSPTGFDAGFVSRGFNFSGERIAGEPMWFAIVVDVDDGAGGWVLSCEVSTDERASWTDLGTPLVTAGSGAYTGGSEFSVAPGALHPTSSTSQLQGSIYEVEIFDAGVSVLHGNYTNLSARDLERGAFSDYVTGQKVSLAAAGSDWAYVRPKATIAGKTPELLLMAGDGNDGHSPLWADRSGNGHHAQVGSAAGSDTNDPVFLNYQGEKYAWLPGTTSNGLSVPDSAQLDVSGDFSVRVAASLPDVSPSAQLALFYKYTTNLGFYFAVQTSGLPVLVWGDGATAKVAQSATVLPSSLEGEWVTYRADLDVDNGAGGWTVTFYYSTDGGVSWTEHGAPVTGAGVTSVGANSVPGTIGDSNAGPHSIQSTQLYADLTETDLRLDVNLADAEEPYATFTERANGATVSIARSASGYVSTVVDRDMWVLSTDDYLQVPDHADLDIGVSDDFTTIIVCKTSIDTLGYLYSKGVGARHAIYRSGDYVGVLNDGTTNVTESITGSAVHTTEAVAVRRDVTADQLEGAFNGVMTGSPTTDTTTATIANSDPFVIGARATASTFGEFQVMSVAFFREALTDDEIKAVSDELLGLGGSTMMLMGVG